MADQSTGGTYRIGGEFDEVVDIRHYTGGDPCQYKCGDPAEFVVVGKSGSTKFTFAGCRSCLNRSSIYPIDNEWVDERTDKVSNA